MTTRDFRLIERRKKSLSHLKALLHREHRRPYTYEAFDKASVPSPIDELCTYNCSGALTHSVTSLYKS
jgi:hypothetical protein